MQPIAEISREEARRYLLAYQGLTGPRRGDAVTWVRRLRAIQFDPLCPFLRSADLTLAARVEGYRPAMLADALYRSRQLLDGWDKCMSIYPAERYPLFARDRAASRAQVSAERWALAMAAAEILEKEGPMTGAEMHRRMGLDGRGKGPGGAWNTGSLGKVLLETLYTAGYAVIAGKEGSVKRFAPAEKYLPPEIRNAPDPAHGDADTWLRLRILDRLHGLGILWDRPGDAWLGIPGAGHAAGRRAALASLAEAGEILPIRVEGQAAWAVPGALEEPGAAPERLEVLAPLDNFLWDRKWIGWLFGFDYTWEVYKPAEKREFGYYVLPILAGGRLVGRVEPRRAPRSGALSVEGLWWEDDAFGEMYADALMRRLEELSRQAEEI